MDLVSTPYGRQWACATRYRIDGCTGSIVIADDAVLSDAQLADSIGGRFRDATDLKKEQTRFRRIAKPLGELEGSRYLSSSEKATLRDARAIVERLARAAELAKERAQRAAKAEERRIQDREREARRLLAAAAIPQAPEQALIYLIALARATANPDMVDDVAVFGDDRRGQFFGDNGSPYEDRQGRFSQWVQNWRRSIESELAREWACRYAPISEEVSQLAETVARQEAAIDHNPPRVLVEFRRLMVEADPKVVVLRPPK